MLINFYPEKIELMSSTLISFVIPAFNEETNIGHTLISIEKHCGEASLEYETIVVDDGSTDTTADIAKRHTQYVFTQKQPSIAAARNFGASNTAGEVLVFLDADIELTDLWSLNITQAISRLQERREVTGSHYSSPPSSNFLHKYWFSSFKHDIRNTHLGSGHLIITKELFNEIGGFNESLKTGEDYEFCQRAQQAGISIVDDTGLKVLHHGFPNSIIEFIRREWWHGSGDRKNWYHSKIALASMLFALLHAATLLAFLTNPTTATAPITLIILLLISFSFIKFRKGGIKTVIINAGIAYFYFWGRTLSLFLPGNRAERTQHLR